MKTVLLILCIAMMAAWPQQSMSFIVESKGTTWKIAEQDLVSAIQEKAKKAGPAMMEKARADAKKKLEHWRDPNQLAGLPTAKSEKLRRVDAEYTLEMDITGPDGTVVYPKGYKYNPLELMLARGMTLPGKYVVINGERAAEVKWAKDNFARDMTASIFVTDGSVMDISKKFKRQTFPLTRTIADRMGVKETPCVVFQPKGQAFLAVKSYVLPDEPVRPEASPAKNNGGPKKAEPDRPNLTPLKF